MPNAACTPVNSHELTAGVDELMEVPVADDIETIFVPEFDNRT